MTAKKTRFKPRKTPSYRRHKATGQGFVELNGKRFYLGRYDSPKSREKYHRTVAEWLAAGRQSPIDPESITVNEMLARFWLHALSYYVRADGEPTCEINNLKQALRPVKELYGRTAASGFGPLALRVVRRRMIDKGLCRTNINKAVNRVKMVFRWAAGLELIQPTVYHGLQAVSGLRRGRSAARESDPVKPVPQSRIDAVKPHVSRQVWAMIRLQLLTAARGGEITAIRPCDVDATGKVWVYQPVEHKTAHHGHARTIYLGPRSQEVLRPFLLRPQDQYCFSPREAEAERRAAATAARKTPLSCGNRPGTNRRRTPQREPGVRFASCSYARAIRTAVRKAFPPPAPLARRDDETIKAWESRLTAEQKEDLKAWFKQHHWHPHQLRHNAAGELRREFGLETARIILGHRSAAVTTMYAEADKRKAVEAMLEVG